MQAYTSREEVKQNLKESIFDLIVIGGGATGAGIALDASSRGLKVALVEKGDFASGTSSKSTKLIHGGLRYLKQLDIALVRETGTERAIVNRIAPHLCLPEKMLLPLTKEGTYGKISTSFGLKVYDLLAGVDRDDRRIMLNKEETLLKEPLLDREYIEGGGFYAEYRTDDARLTIELIKKSKEYGALPINYCEATEFCYTDDKIGGIICQDIIKSEKFEIKGLVIVSAAGPWVDKIRQKNDSINNKRLHLTKGIHLVFPWEKFPVNQSVYFDEPSGRMLFAIPRGLITYLGTTDTNYYGNMERIVCTKQDRDYLLKAANHTFPSLRLGPKDVISNWAGVRPLIHEEGKSPSELSRKDEIFESEDGLISIAGGKLTGYRKMAERIVDLVAERIEDSTNRKIRSAFTKSIPLGSDKLLSNEDIEEMITDISDKVEKLGLDRYYGWYLVTNYGMDAQAILDSATAPFGEMQLAEAELRYGIKYEMITRAEDFLVRRTGKLYFDINSLKTIRDLVIKILAKELHWDEERVAQENKIVDDLIYDATHYYEKELP